MYVVRISIGDQGDYKAFGAKADAEKRFWSGWVKVDDYDGASCALYQVEADGPREAIESVKRAASNVTLLTKMPMDVEVDLVALGLVEKEA